MATRSTASARVKGDTKMTLAQLDQIIEQRHSTIVRLVKENGNPGEVMELFLALEALHKQRATTERDIKDAEHMNEKIRDDLKILDRLEIVFREKAEGTASVKKSELQAFLRKSKEAEATVRTHIGKQQTIEFRDALKTFGSESFHSGNRV